MVVAFISDIMMPNSGRPPISREAVRNSESASVPFVFLTAMSDKQNVLEAKKHGAQGYLLKPITMDKVKEKLKELFPKRQFPFSNAS